MKCASKRECFSWRNVVVATMAVLLASSATSLWAVVITDGFGDADRDNANGITFYDTDVNNSGTWNVTTGDPNNPGPDENLNDKGLIEVTAAEDASDVGIKWSATRGFTSSNTGDPKANIKIINDNVATGIEPQNTLHNSGLALGYEGKGNGSSMIGAFGQPVVLGPDVGNMIVVKIDARWWFEADNDEGLPAVGEMRWGLFQDTDDELGLFDTVGLIDPNGVQASVEWGAEDGDWRSNQPGPEGDKGIWTALPNGIDDPNTGVDGNDARIRYEYNLAGINGTSNNGRFLEGSGASNTPGSGGDVSTVASPTGDGPGGVFGVAGPVELRMDIIRLAGGLLQVATYVDGVELLRDEIKPTDSGASFMQPAPESFDYFAFRNASGKQDHVFDNFEIRNVVPEPTSMLLLSLGSLLALGRNRRR